MLTRLHVGGIFFYLVKAFDCVNHEIWLGKLHFCKIQRVPEDRFRFSLTNRRQKVEAQSPSEPELFGDDTSVIISSRNFENFCSVSNLIACLMVEWFAASKLA
jgi:hypothetical protein